MTGCRNEREGSALTGGSVGIEPAWQSQTRGGHPVDPLKKPALGYRRMDLEACCRRKIVVGVLKERVFGDPPLLKMALMNKEPKAFSIHRDQLVDSGEKGASHERMIRAE